MATPKEKLSKLLFGTDKSFLTKGDREAAAKKEEAAKSGSSGRSRDSAMGSSKNISTKEETVKPASSGKSFSQAFREARAEGKDSFTWNGKKYTTEMAGAKKDKKEESETFTKSEPEVEDTDEGRTTTFKRGGTVKSSASKRADGCCIKGKTRGKMV